MYTWMPYCSVILIFLYTLSFGAGPGKRHQIGNLNIHAIHKHKRYSKIKVLHLNSFRYTVHAPGSSWLILAFMLHYNKTKVVQSIAINNQLRC